MKRACVLMQLKLRRPCCLLMACYRVRAGVPGDELCAAAVVLPAL